MIKEKVEKENQIEFICNCNKCKTDYKHIKELEPYEEDPKLSTTETAFCENDKAKFITWLKNKDYLKRDCWCQHIKEWINAKI